MKVNPRQQTLILASERRSLGAKSGDMLGKAITAASSGGVLKRVTIVAAQPDSSVLYLHADYAETPGDSGAPSEPASLLVGASTAAVSAGGARSAGRLAPFVSAGGAVVSSFAYGSARDMHGNQAITRDVGLSTYLSPAEQYAQTQRILGPSLTSTTIDVRA